MEDTVNMYKFCGSGEGQLGVGFDNPYSFFEYFRIVDDDEWNTFELEDGKSVFVSLQCVLDKSSLLESYKVVDSSDLKELQVLEKNVAEGYLKSGPDINTIACCDDMVGIVCSSAVQLYKIVRPVLTKLKIDAKTLPKLFGGKYALIRISALAGVDFVAERDIKVVTMDQLQFFSHDKMASVDLVEVKTKPVSVSKSRPSSTVKFQIVDLGFERKALSASHVFREIRPPHIKDERLFDREDSAKRIAYLLCSSGGKILTPTCDQSFGAGKTSLMFKFRGILKGLDWTPPKNYSDLDNAVYIHILLGVQGKMSTNPVEQTTKLLSAIREALSTSCSSYLELRTESTELFIKDLKAIRGTTKFLFHFDEVGSYERISVEYGCSMIYRIREVGVALSKLQNYYVLTGRSSILTLLGSDKILQDLKQSQSLHLPDKLVLIPLPHLSVDGVGNVLVDINVAHMRNQAAVIRRITGGVPRAVYSAAVHFSLYRLQTEVIDNIESTLTTIAEQNTLMMKSDDLYKFRCCVEHAWRGTVFANESVLMDEYAAAMVARLRLYRTSERGSFSIVVPEYLLYSHVPSMRSVFAILDKGTRFESMCRRIIALRSSISPCTCWTHLGLSSLDQCRFPFPITRTWTPFVFPKTGEDVLQCMIGKPGEADLKECPTTALPDLINLMQVGEYYFPVDKSKFGDAIVRCTESQIVSLHLKNTDEHFIDSWLVEEAIKGSIVGFECFMAILCRSGNGKPTNTCRDIGGVKVAYLCRKSVQDFINIQTLDTVNCGSALQSMEPRVKMQA